MTTRSASRLFVFVALTTTAALQGCYTIQNACCPDDHCKPQHPGEPDDEDPVRPLFSNLDPTKAPDPFWVAESPTGMCRDLQSGRGVWISRQIVPLDAPSVLCGYVWQNTSTDAAGGPDSTVFASTRDIVRPEADEPALAVQSDPYPGTHDVKAWLKPLYELARSRFGLPAVRSSQAGRVRVAVIDSATGDYYGRYRDSIGHGRTVGRIIEDIACDGQKKCPVEIKNYAALTLVSTDKREMGSPASGAGAYGTRGQLADQIERASSEWANERATGRGPQHLVINLSVGWSGCFEPEKGMSLESTAVYKAMQRASCRGAVIIAAGGNRDAIEGCPGNADRKGVHVYPAQWATNHERPTAATCQRFGISSPSDEQLGPLVIGVSAVDEFDEPLALADQGSTLVAYGNALAMPDRHSTWTHQLAGTSVSAAVVSGTAAALWSMFPARSARQLEADLIEPAPYLGQRVSSQPNFICNDIPASLTPPECESVRRASLCRSLAHAQGTVGDCGPQAHEAPTSSFGEMNASLPVEASFDCSQCPAAGPAACAVCEPPAPTAIDSAEQPWAVGPQPPGDSCGTCKINRSARRFEATFKSSWWPTMKAVKLAIPGLSTISLKAGTLTSSSLKVSISAAAAAATSGTLKYTRVIDGLDIYFTESLIFAPDGGGTSP